MKAPTTPHSAGTPDDGPSRAPFPELRAHSMPPHPFKRDLIVRSDIDGSAQIRDLTKVVEASRVCPINAYVKLREEDQLFNALNRNHPVAVRGIWRMGKTEMLATMFSRKKLLDDTISLNFQETPSSALVNSDLSTFRAKIGQAQVAEFLARKKLISADHPEDIDFSTLIEQTMKLLEKYDGGSRGGPFDLLSRYLARERSHAYVVFDEAIVLARSPELVQEVGRIAQLPGIRSVIVLQKHPTNDERFLEMFGKRTDHFVECLDLDDCGRIGKALVAGTELEFTPGAIAVVREWSGGRPFEVSALCHVAIESHIERGVQEARLKASDVRETFDARLRESVGITRSVLAPAIENYLKIYHVALSDAERGEMQRIAKATAIHLGDMDPAMVERLTAFSLVSVTGNDQEAKFVRINGELLRLVLSDPNRYSLLDHWIRDEYGNDGI